MKEHSQIAAQVQRWSAAGLIDAQAAERILAFEAGQERKATLRWPVFLAMIFGGMLLAAGVTLFVAAHWGELSPALRFSLMIVLAGLFHICGALLAERFSALATTLHGVGTATLGAAIFLTAQIFNLHENWATGILLWSLGAAAGYALLRDWVQATFLAILAPAWLISQWEITTEWRAGGGRLLSVGLILTAICYLSARIGEQTGTARRALAAIGTIAFVPCTITASIIALEGRISRRYHNSETLTSGILLLGWTVAVVGPLVLAWFLRRRAAWVNVLWIGWAYGFVLAASYARGEEGNSRNLGATATLYILCAVGSVGLVVWGLYEKRKERLNLGIFCFAISVLFFYFDSFMGKLGRSASLLILGLLCLAGGYALEVTRRRLVARMELPS